MQHHAEKSFYNDVIHTLRTVVQYHVGFKSPSNRSSVETATLSMCVKAGSAGPKKYEIGNEEPSLQTSDLFQIRLHELNMYLHVSKVVEGVMYSLL